MDQTSTFCDQNPCTDPCIGRHNFNFTELQLITEAINKTCGSSDSRLATINPPALTHAACVVIANKGILAPTWYPAADVWARLTSWKFPLVQLAALFPRPPLGFWIEIFVFLHLLGNPISTLQDMIIKFASCQSRALYWKFQFCDNLRNLVVEAAERDRAAERNRALQAAGRDRILGQAAEQPDSSSPRQMFAKFEQLWKAFALIIDSCDEWGRNYGEYTREVLQELLETFNEFENAGYEELEVPLAPLGSDSNNMTIVVDQERLKSLRTDVVRSCLRTGKALAADRGTKLFPVSVAVALFIGAIIIAFARTSNAGPDSSTVFINVEAYSVAFSATYFWIVPLVIIGAAVGSSQTETAIPRILKRLERELNSLLGVTEDMEADWIAIVREDINEREESTKSDARKRNGGIYSWQYNVRRGPSNYKSIDLIESDINNYNGYLRVEGAFTKSPPFGLASPLHRDRGAGQPWYWRALHWTNLVLEILSWPVLCLFWLFYRPLAPIRHKSAIFPIFIVSVCLVTAWAISFGVPGEWFGCRIVGQFGILFCFLINRFFDPVSLVEEKPSTTANSLISWQALRDSVVVLVTFVWVISTQCGLFNSCTCYTFWHLRRLILPTDPQVATQLYDRIQRLYPAIAFLSIFFQLLFVPGIIFWQYFEAFQVFVQRDDKTSNVSWAQNERRQVSPWHLEWLRPTPPARSDDTIRRGLSGHEGVRYLIKRAVANCSRTDTLTQPGLVSAGPSRQPTYRGQGGFDEGVAGQRQDHIHDGLTIPETGVHRDSGDLSVRLSSDIESTSQTSDVHISGSRGEDASSPLMARETTAEPESLEGLETSSGPPTRRGIERSNRGVVNRRGGHDGSQSDRPSGSGSGSIYSRIP